MTARRTDLPPPKLDITEHQALAQWFIRRYLTKNRSHVDVIDSDDLFQAAMIGLDRASRTWDPKQGKWTTYAAVWMRKEVEQCLHTGSTVLSIPNRLVQEDSVARSRGDARDPLVRDARERIMYLDHEAQGGSDSEGLSAHEYVWNPTDPPVESIVLGEARPCESDACRALDLLAQENQLMASLVADSVIGGMSLQALGKQYRKSTAVIKRLIAEGLARLSELLAADGYTEAAA